MINWFALFVNSLWILACAIALATLSYASWRASLRGEKFGVILQGVPYQISFDLSGVLFCLGLAGTSGKSWEIGCWLVLTALFIAHLVAELARHRKSRPTPIDRR